MNRAKSLLVVFALLSTGPAWGAEDDAAGQQVRVAAGVTMEYAGSARSNAEWAKRRPNFAALKPKKRDK